MLAQKEERGREGVKAFFHGKHELPIFVIKRGYTHNQQMTSLGLVAPPLSHHGEWLNEMLHESTKTRASSLHLSHLISGSKKGKKIHLKQSTFLGVTPHSIKSQFCLAPLLFKWNCKHLCGNDGPAFNVPYTFIHNTHCYWLPDILLTELCLSLPAAAGSLIGVPAPPLGPLPKKSISPVVLS